ncbi:hypothetical protein BpHYR1_041828 [Brachionus plicatilis]|uniref:Uncharacterized protein n=1 Tax=Brachionus plicatilis TaxID=10195 RepID=A0A3M7PYU5_BRAPC|nr:hypothetical protein BpHYR1_041828 [Brachionus plicatilis]
MHSDVRVLSSGMAFLSFCLNISLIIETRFHIASGSRPLSGLRRLVYSADAADEACSKHSTSLTTLGVGAKNLTTVFRIFSCKTNSSKHHWLILKHTKQKSCFFFVNRSLKKRKFEINILSNPVKQRQIVFWDCYFNKNSFKLEAGATIRGAGQSPGLGFRALFPAFKGNMQASFGRQRYLVEQVAKNRPLP